MKQLWKTEDRAMERLLRGHLSQRSDAKQVCKQFDPDLANAYIEHRLTTVEREEFEQHMSLCASCRTATVALTRLSAADAPPSVVRPAQQELVGWRERLGALAAPLATPRWAMAATAVLVAAVSIPVFMSRSTSSERAPGVAQQAADASPASGLIQTDKPSPEARSTPETGGSEPRNPVDLVAQNPVPRSNQTATPGGIQGGFVAQAPALTPPEAQPAPVSEAQNPVGQVEKKEPPAGAPASPVQSREQVAADSQQAASTTQQQAPTSDQLARIDPKNTRPTSEAEKDSAHVSVLKTGRADGEERAKGDTKIRPEDNNAPPSPIAGADAGARRTLAQPPSASSMRDGRKLSEAVRSRATAERKIGKKRFWLRDEIWTDNDYKPEKEMPMVTLVRDSDVFKEVIGKRATLKGYLTAFAENERAIVVYKGTIYKLIPQDGNK